MTDRATINGLHTEIDKLITKLESRCFDPACVQEATRDARIRRIQLIAIRDYLLGNKAKL